MFGVDVENGTKRSALSKLTYGGPEVSSFGAESVITTEHLCTIAQYYIDNVLLWEGDSPALH